MVSLALPARPVIAQDSHHIYDIVIYGGTSAGVSAAVQTSRMGRSVILIEPGNHLGGLSSSGLGQTDIGNKKVIGGIAQEFYQRLYQHYTRPSSWIFQKSDRYLERQKDWDDKKIWWKFEPHVAKSTFESMVEEAGVRVVLNERLDLENGIEKVKTRIRSIKTESGRTFTGKIFIDATYEGDLMAKAGVSCTIGRESNSQYGESLNGVQLKDIQNHQILDGVDPYVERGNPRSGLLPGIDPGGPGDEGAGDHRVQAYCFRLCLTDFSENRIAFEKPERYNPLEYELLLRNFEAGAKEVPWINSAMPNRKTDTNNSNKEGISTDYIGHNYDWPDGNYQIRAEIFEAHKTYQKGLMWTLANHPRVPTHVRDEVSRWGLAADEFKETDNWPPQLYVREARRMVSDYVMTEKNCIGEEEAENSIGMAAYSMDSHNVQRYIDRNGFVKNEGNVATDYFMPYPIDYQSIIPGEHECENLLVPVCLSASHIAYGSIRMEPVFMILGQSAATAGCLAIGQNKRLQDLEYADLERALLSAGQILDLPYQDSESHFLTDWWIIGPFDNSDGKGLLTPYAPESDFYSEKSYYARDSVAIDWQYHSDPESAYIQFTDLLSPFDQGVAYAYRTIEVMHDTVMIIGIGSNDGTRLWVNGKLYLDIQTTRKALPNEDVMEIPFKKGANDVLIKVDQFGGDWGFYFSIIAAEVQ